MKKLFILCSLLAVAGVGQAATINWYSAGDATTRLVGATDGQVLTAVPDGGSIVLVKLAAADITAFNAGTWTATSATELDTATVAAGGVYGAGYVSGDYNFAAESGVLAANDYVAVVLKNSDGTYEQLRYYDSGAAGGIGAAVTNMKQLDEESVGDVAFSDFAFATAGNFVAPEPTSAMLLLLGMAGMMLRRKRA